MGLRLTAKLAAGACVVALAGCGGDDDAPIEPIGESTEAELTTVEEPLDEEAFIQEADGLCAEANIAIASAEENAATSETLAITDQLEITQGVLDGLEELDPPDDPTGQLDAYVAALEEQASILEEQEAAAEAGDTTTLSTLGSELEAARSEGAAAASEYGFEDCGGEGTATAPDSETSTGTGGTGTTAPTTPAPAPVPVEPAPAPAPVEPAPAPAPAPAPEPAPTPTPTPPPDSGGSGSGSGGIAP